MGQTALETALNELKLVLLLPFFFFAGQIIYDIGGLCRVFVQKRATWTDFFSPPLNEAWATPS